MKKKRKSQKKNQKKSQKKNQKKSQKKKITIGHREEESLEDKKKTEKERYPKLKKIEIELPERKKSSIPLEDQIPLPQRTDEEGTKQRKERADKGVPRGEYKGRREKVWSAPFDSAVIVLTRGLAKVLKDPSWETTEEEAEDFSLAFNTLLDEYVPDKKLSNGWILLISATGGYVLPRVVKKKPKAITEKKETPEKSEEPASLKDALEEKETPLTAENINDYKPKKMKA